ncbi:MAG: flagellar basal body P-ring protein FlgI [Desulfobacterales bacterium]|nr:flagellar basal body P-ring protein FlgI [Desulfobacterales bacterium]
MNLPATPFRWLMAAVVLLALAASPVSATRIKDIVDLRGVRSNQLVGYGLVVGLDGTGDKGAAFTVQSMSSMLEKMGMTVDPKNIAADNVASVMVTANLPAFGRAGSRMDVLVSSIGGAKNLQGGTLLFTPLKGADGRVYVVAQGPVSTGGFSAGGKSGASVQKNFPTVGRVVGGGTIERSVKTAFDDQSTIALALHRPDFTTAARVADAINRAFFQPLAHSVDGGSVEVQVPEKYLGNVVAFVTQVEALGVTPDTHARVVINERTGTVVMGADVRISTIAIAHGNLSIQISESTQVSQPLPFSQGQTVAAPQSDVSVSEERAPVYLMEPGVSIGEVVRALNLLGVSPRDLIAIFQAIKAAGALQAELEII